MKISNKYWRIARRLQTQQLQKKSTPGETITDRELFELDIGKRGSSLFLGDGTAHFKDVTASMGPFSNGWAWGGVFTDFDNDGWQDLFSTNGFVSGKSMKDN